MAGETVTGWKEERQSKLGQVLVLKSFLFEPNLVRGAYPPHIFCAIVFYSWTCLLAGYTPHAQRHCAAFIAEFAIFQMVSWTQTCHCKAKSSGLWCQFGFLAKQSMSCDLIQFRSKLFKPWRCVLFLSTGTQNADESPLTAKNLPRFLVRSCHSEMAAPRRAGHLNTKQTHNVRKKRTKRWQPVTSMN